MIIVVLLIVILLSCAFFYSACFLVMLFTGCTLNAAEQHIQNWISAKLSYQLSKDSRFLCEIESNVEKIIGEERYTSLLRLSESAISYPLLTYDYNGNLPCINVTVAIADDSEKVRIESVLNHLLKQKLRIHGLSDITLVKWDIRPDLKMPYLSLIYSQNRQQQIILERIMVENKNDILQRYSTLVDDETEDLNE